MTTWRYPSDFGCKPLFSKALIINKIRSYNACETEEANSKQAKDMERYASALTDSLSVLIRSFQLVTKKHKECFSSPHQNQSSNNSSVSFLM